MKERNLYPLGVTQITGDLIETFNKILKDMDPNQLYTMATNTIVTIEATNTSFSRSDCRKRVEPEEVLFSLKVVDNWNNLPPNVKT